MKTSYLAKACVLGISMLIILSMSGVFAAWYYCGIPLADEQVDFGFSTHMFTWKPEDILPTEKPGENYLVLLNSILNNSKGGLNSGKGTVENAVKKDWLVHSSQNVQGGNLKHLFITEPCKDLDFVIRYISNTEFHVFMYENDDLEAGTVDVTHIKVFKTVLIETNGVWSALESQQGHALIRRFKGTSNLAITPEEWVIGVLLQQ